MFGRSVLCLLASFVLSLAPRALNAQADSSAISQSAIGVASELLQSQRVVPLSPPDPVGQRLPARRLRAVTFPEIARAAGTIFYGKVIAIERRPATHGQAVETVAITFRVDSAIRGAVPGDRLTISQWIGLWSSGQRYRIGERVLLFLYAPSKLGLTSCVAGPIGRFSVDVWGRVLFSAQHLSAFRKDPVLGGKSRIAFSDFALAVRQASEEE